MGKPTAMLLYVTSSSISGERSKDSSILLRAPPKFHMPNMRATEAAMLANTTPGEPLLKVALNSTLFTANCPPWPASLNFRKSIPIAPRITRNMPSMLVQKI